jgi:hypothetical protein
MIVYTYSYSSNSSPITNGRSRWKSGMNYLAAVNRVSSLVKTNKLDAKLRNENYCKTNFGPHATQVIMDAIDSSKMK